jgi:hypothetical protein
MSSAPTTAPSAVRLADALTALSLATDAGKGAPLEKSLRTAVIATRLGSIVGLRGAPLADAYYVALLRSLGCTAFAPETAALLGGDDVAFHGLYDQLDPGHSAEFVRDVVTGMGAWAGPAVRARSVARFLTVGRRVAPMAGRSACEVSTALAGRLGLTPEVTAGLLDVYERWDGRGIPDGTAGERLSLAARITHVADQAEIAHRAGGARAARATALRRAGATSIRRSRARSRAAPTRSSTASTTGTCSSLRSTPSPRRTRASRAASWSAWRTPSRISSTSSRRGCTGTRPRWPSSPRRRLARLATTCASPGSSTTSVA